MTNDFYETEYAKIKIGVLDMYEDNMNLDEDEEDEINRETDKRFEKEFGFEYSELTD